MDVRDTDWSQVVTLYDQLAGIDPSPIVALNRAVALAEVDGPEVALAVVDRLDLGGYHAYHATCADADLAARRMPALRTRRPSSWQATAPRSRTSLAGATSSGSTETV